MVVLEIITYDILESIINEYFYHLPARSLEYIYSVYPSPASGGIINSTFI